ncbi:MAG TPA: excinuclease ABC subunit UvrB [Caldisericia bacterium]|nr:excinuclease ABC subunit UvrB [Caldisericia bacterium]HPF48273.1 excinuclease ABC subunit UvrB [Caldisericia bacterium]HPI83548.1 excinuclease ABC subunit UvrB [Caldisericia bacterium]HPQ92726.1 excinuclease ABC subunit UvrB [Caldisericia bacterium]HRV74176.1 excinuclease ABC subunit UvrB [Caldisericia bacterium]
MDEKFKLVSDFSPSGDQPQAIEKLVDGIWRGVQFQTLLGVTGSGKTYTMAKVIETVNRPTLVIAHNKTLAAQLYSELSEFFPENAVEYFVSYYDYYQPEAYVPTRDLYIAKETDINDDIMRLRHSTVRSLLERRDVIVVASVSCIYGWESPEGYKEQLVGVKTGDTMLRDDFIRGLVGMQYARNNIAFEPGNIRVRGSTVDVWPAETEGAVRVIFEFDEIIKVCELDPVTGSTSEDIGGFMFFPAKAFVTTQERLNYAVPKIMKELDDQKQKFEKENKPLEAERIVERTKYDLEMLREVGYCNGIENYSMHLSGRDFGMQPYTLMNFFPEDTLMIIDESHMTVPQIRGMFAGDQARKKTLVDFGFRLPSAMENRPLGWDEFQQFMRQVVFVSATPADYEKEISEEIAEQLIRPTGLLDPEVEVRPIAGQIDNLKDEVRKRVEKDERTLVTVLTKRMAEDLADFLLKDGFKVCYLHSDVGTIDRVDILKKLREGVFQVIVGVNLLREGLDLPEVSLIAILDADKEGFLRSTTSLVQTIGRAARNVSGKVIMYADNITNSMRHAIDETNRRRKAQIEYNEKHGIEPQTIRKAIKDMLNIPGKTASIVSGTEKGMSKEDVKAVILQLTDEMNLAATMLEFEKAAQIRDQIAILKQELIQKGKGYDDVPSASSRTKTAQKIKSKLAQAELRKKR